ncbi:MAG: zinc-ribbon domain-containing protein [Alphaproteobacteria bacterium]|nr:zinc-ribbon domain-containing protein [Alphaproteobacteria bacterium]
MSLIKCRECGKEISASARRCPNCGGKVSRGGRWLKRLVLLVLLLAAGWFLWTNFGSMMIAGPAKTQEIIDAEQEYELIAAEGDVIQTCVQAGIVAQAYLQAQDEAGYNQWKEIEMADCMAAGL